MTIQERAANPNTASSSLQRLETPSLSRFAELFPTDQQESYVDLIEFDQEAAELCASMREGVAERDTQLIEFVQRELTTTFPESTAQASSTSSSDTQEQLDEFNASVWRVVMNAGLKREKLMAEFRYLVMSGKLDVRWPLLADFFARCKHAIISSDQRLNKRFLANQFGQFHVDMLGRGEEFIISPSEANTLLQLNTFLETNPEGQKLFHFLIGDPNNLQGVETEGELFRVQRYRLEQLTRTVGIAESQRRKIIAAGIDHLKMVTAEAIKYRPHNYIAALVASVHDYYKYGFTGDGQKMIVELGLHELLSARGGTLLLTKLLDEHLPEEHRSNILSTALHKTIPLTIFAHGFNHFPDAVSRMQPVIIRGRYENDIPDECQTPEDLAAWKNFTISEQHYKDMRTYFRVLFGSVYPLCLRSKYIPGVFNLNETSSERKFISEVAFVVSGADKWIGAFFESFKKYHMDTPAIAVTSSESLVMYFITRTLASFLNCTETDDVQDLIKENRHELTTLQTKVALTLAALAQVSPLPEFEPVETDLSESVHTYQHDELGAASQEYPNAHRWLNVFRSLLNSSSTKNQWQQLSQLNTERDFLDAISQIKMSLNQQNYRQYAVIEKQAADLQVLYLKYKQDTQQKDAFDTAFLELLSQTDNLDVDNLLQVISANQDVLNQLLITLRALTGDAAQQAEIKLP